MRKLLTIRAARLSVLLLPVLAGWGGAAQAATIRVLVASGDALTVRVPIAQSVAQPGIGQGGAGQGGTVQAGIGQGGAAQTPPGGFAAWTVSAQGSRLLLGAVGGAAPPQDAGSGTLYLPPAPGSSVEVAGKLYRGGLLLRAVKGGVNAVNVLDLEDYLRGVVGAEMPNSWPTEALRAQAVIARTYAAARINPAGSYDLCATESCQVYGGVSRESPATDAAIASTRDQVVSWAGRAASTFFSSDSGGYTASSLEAWGLDLPYLQARPDPASQGPNSRWTLSVPLARVGDVASRYGVRVGAIRSVTVTAVSASGRATSLVLTGASGSRTLSGADAGGFLRSLGARSSRVNLGGSDPLVIEGAGNGHGVGLSQYGAAGLARGGWNYLQIMGFYYAGASISSILQGRADGLGEGAPLTAGLPLPGAGQAPLGQAAALQAAPASVAPLLSRAVLSPLPQSVQGLGALPAGL